MGQKKSISALDLQSYIASILHRPKMYAHDCTSLSAQVHLLYSMWCACEGLAWEYSRDVFDELGKKYAHGNVLFGALFEDQNELANVFMDTFAARHGWVLVRHKLP